MPQQRDHDFEIIPDAMSRYEAVKETLNEFTNVYAHDVADAGHAEFAKSMCMDMVNILVQTYNEIDDRHFRVV